MRKTIQVTEEHIDAGKPTACYACPIALALSWRFSRSVCIDRTYTVFFHKKETLKIKGELTPSSAFCNSSEIRDWMDKFDEGFQVDPITLELDTKKRTLTVQGVQ